MCVPRRLLAVIRAKVGKHWIAPAAADALPPEAALLHLDTDFELHRLSHRPGDAAVSRPTTRRVLVVRLATDSSTGASARSVTRAAARSACSSATVGLAASACLWPLREGERHLHLDGHRQHRSRPPSSAGVGSRRLRASPPSTPATAPWPNVTWSGRTRLTYAGRRLISRSCGADGASWIRWTRRAAVEAAGGCRCAQPGYGPRDRVGTARLRPWRGDRRHRTRTRPRGRRDRAGWRPCGQRGYRFRCGKSCSGRPQDSRSGAPSPARSS